MYLRVAWTCYALFVAYGSLVPLDFRPLPIEEAWLRFQQAPFLKLGVESRADWIANGVLYAPLGFLGTWALLQRGWWGLLALPVAVALCVGLAAGVEFAQVFFPPRTVSLNDLLAEAIGSVVGAIAALAFWRRGGGRPPAIVGSWLQMHGLALYAAAYLAFCLFPYDLLLSSDELRQKLDSAAWGWWLAGSARGPLVVALQLLVEIALTVPLGVWLARRAGAPQALTGAAALAAGLLLGLAVELAQLLIASGVTQGASVLTRAAGMVLGLVCWRQRARWSVAGLRAALARHRGAATLGYLLLLVGVNGWFTLDWAGLEVAADRWGALRLLPFYYHYYTSEAVALVSLASVTLMYLPVGALAWAGGRSALVAALTGAAVCAVVEASKLFLTGLHPDPTNVLIAAAASAAWGLAAGWWAAQREPRQTHGEPQAALAQGASPASAGGLRWLALPVAGMLFATHALSAPAFALATTGLVAVCAALIWRRPAWLLIVVPALLPALDLAPWTGRFFWDEFDVLLAVCLAVAWVRTAPARASRTDWLWRLAFGALALSFAASTVLGAMPWPWPDANSVASYLSPYNALRIVKGVVWAGLFIAVLRRLDGPDATRNLATGMALGLAYTVAFVLWERLAFVGLLDFADDYRVTGPFSAMHRGGAYIECYIAFALPFALQLGLQARHWGGRVLAGLLVLAASYTMAVTFSRNGYAAFAAAFGVFSVLALTRGLGGAAALGLRGRVFAGVAMIAAVTVTALPVLLGPFALERLANWEKDLAVRQAHWADALALRDEGIIAAAFGMGVGRFPQTHFWRSREPVRAASYRIESEGEMRFLRLGGGAPLYIDQIVKPEPGRTHVVALRIRSGQPGASINVSVCEKWMLTSRRCATVRLQGGDMPNAWSTAEAAIDLTALGTGGQMWPRPVKFALHAPAQGLAVDVAQVSLRDGGGRDLLVNGDFASGIDRWYFSTDVATPWQIDNLPLAVLFDQGWFGVAAWAVVLLGALSLGAAAAWGGSVPAAAALAALVAFLVSGTLNTLIDEPRFLFLLLLAAWLCFANRTGLNQELDRARKAPASDRPGRSHA